MIERVGHAFRQADAGRRRSQGYVFDASVSRDRGAVHFAPYVPPGAEGPAQAEAEHRRAKSDGSQVVWRFSSMELGGRRIAHEATRWHLRGNTAQELLEPDLGIVDHVFSGDRGVERSWCFPRPLDRRGDLVIRTELLGMQLITATNTGYHFGTNGRARVNLGNAYLVESNGKRTILETALSGGRHEIRIPANTLATAAYPIVVDPVVSAEYGVDTPVLRDPDNYQFEPRIAGDETGLFAVWTDERNRPQKDIYGTRLTLESQQIRVLDPLGINLTPGDSRAGKPHVAAATTAGEYLVVWEDVVADASGDIRATRVDTNGLIVGTPELAIAATPSLEESWPAVASDGINFLVAFSSGPDPDLYAVVFDTTTGHVGTTAAVRDTTGAAREAAVEFNGTDYVAVWADSRGAVKSIYSNRINASGQPADTLGNLVWEGTYGSHEPDLAWNGTQFGAVWNEEEVYSLWRAYGRFLDVNGVASGPWGLPAGSGYHDQPVDPRIGGHTSGTHFVVAWSEPYWRVYARRVNNNHTVRTVRALSAASQRTRVTDVLGVGDGFVGVWNGSTYAEYYDSHGVVLDADGELLSGPELLASVTNEARQPSIAASDSNLLVAWSDDRNMFANNDVYATRIELGATVDVPPAILDPDGLALAAGVTNQWAPSVASNGSSFLVVWHDTGQHGIGAATVPVTGDPGPAIIISDPQTHQYGPSITSNGTNYLAIWTDSSGYVEGALVDATGSVIHSEQYATDGYFLSTAVGSNGNGFLFAGAVLGDNAVLVREIDASGHALGAGTTNIAAGDASYIGGVAVSGAGSGFVASWTGSTPVDWQRFVRARRFGSGLPVGDVYTVYTTGDGMPFYPFSVVEHGDTMLAVWPENYPATGDMDIVGAFFSADGSQTEARFDIAADAAHQERDPQAVVAPNGLVAVTYQKRVLYGDVYGYRAQLRVLASDSDNDGVPDASDNCVAQANPDQSDLDSDGEGDVCDADVDNDGIDNTSDACPAGETGWLSTTETDADGDGCSDVLEDEDDDNDQSPDDVDCGPLDPSQYPGAPEQCDLVDSDCDQSLADEFSDFDADGLPDCVDPTFVFSPRDGLVTTEGGGSASFSVALSVAPTSTVALHLISTDPAEGNPLPESLVFSTGNWSSAQTVTVTGVDDTAFDVDTAYAISGSGASTDANYDGLPMLSVGVTNQNDDIAGPLNGAELAEYAETLYSGANPRQVGVDPSAIDSTRVAIMRGRAIDGATGSPMAGVRVEVLFHDEFGSTETDESGIYEMAVNGGDMLTARLWLDSGYQEVQRREFVSILKYAYLDDSELTPHDVDSMITLNASAWQYHVSSESSDGDGPRRDVLIIPAGVTAQILHADGSTTPLTGAVQLRSTEYTEGTQDRMPAELPAQTAFTYAVEHSLVGYEGESVEWSAPVYEYVDNFLGFPVGTTVPSGYYDRAAGHWVASDDGRVIEIAAISIEGDGIERALLDSVGAFSGPSLVISDEEREKLAEIYPASSYPTPHTLWRVPLIHFSPSDLNWPPVYGYAEGAEDPNGGDPKSPDANTPKDPCREQGGSFIYCESQALGEEIQVPGAPFSLTYSSALVPGRKSAYTLTIPLRGATVPDRLLWIEVRAFLAGNAVHLAVPPDTTGETHTAGAGRHLTLSARDNVATLVWDGRDAKGQWIRGVQRVEVGVGFQYPVSYGVRVPSTARTRGFGYSAGSSASLFVGTMEPPSDEVRMQTLWLPWVGSLGTLDSRALELGGWSLSIQHSYDPERGRIYQQTGGTRTREEPELEIRSELNPGATAYDRGYIEVAPNGDIYGSRHWMPSPCNVRRRPRGERRDANNWPVVAGSGPCVTGGDGKATEVPLNTVLGMDLAPDGRLYMAEYGADRIRVLDFGADPSSQDDDTISTFAGSGVAGYCGDGGDRLQACFYSPRDVAVGPDGSVYVADTNNHRVRRITTDGTVTTFAGCGAYAPGECIWEEPADQPLPATEAYVHNPHSVDVALDGSVYITSSYRILKVGVDGRITRIAGVPDDASPDRYGERGFSGDGGPATEAMLFLGSDDELALAEDGTVFIANGPHGSPRIRQIDTDGIINTIAGAGTELNIGSSVTAVAFGWPGRVYVVHDSYWSLSSIGGDTSWKEQQPVVVPSEDGSEVYVFTPEGRHVRTKDALTGAVLFDFTYDDSDRLVLVTDVHGNVTEIARDPATGEPAAIVAPGGQATELALDENGFLALVTNPANEQVSMQYTDDGLLTRLVDARAGVHEYDYDDLGRLVIDEDPKTIQDDTPEDRGLSWRRLQRTELADGYQVDLSTALGFSTSYRVEVDDDTMVRTITRPGQSSSSIVEIEGTTTTTMADGTVTVVTEARDPRFGLAAPLLNQTVTTPTGLTWSSEHTRSATFTDPDDPTTLTDQVDTYSVNGRTTTATYTQADHTILISSPGCNDGDGATPCRQSQMTLNAAGQLVAWDPDGPSADVVSPVSYTYFAATGQLESVTQGSRASSFEYYDSGPSRHMLETITLPDSNAVALSYDEALRTTSISIPGQSPPGNEVNIVKDPDGRLVSVTTPTARTHVLSYDEVGLPDKYSPPLVGDHSVEDLQTDADFDLDRRWTGTALPGGSSVTPTYDPSTGRLEAVESSMPPRFLAYGYDGAGRINPIESRLNGGASPDYDSGRLDFTYDGFLPTSQSWSVGVAAGTVTRVYDNSFRVADQLLTCMPPAVCNAMDLDPSGDDFQYDVDGFLVQAGGLAVSRDPMTGFVSGTTLADTVTQHTYNSYGEQVAWTASHTTGGMLYEEEIVDRDLMGRITARVETINGTSVRYDYEYWEMGRLKRVATCTPAVDKTCADTPVCIAEYTYDDNGNRLSVACGDSTPVTSYDEQDRLTSSNGATYTYSLAGSLEIRANGPDVTTTVYDAFGNLLTVVLPDARQIDYVVDPLNRRVGKRENGALVKTWLYQDGLRPVAELDDAGNLRARFVYAGARNVPDYMITYAEDGTQLATYRIITDHLGSVRLVVNASTGAVAQRMVHDVWGNVLEDTNPGFQPFGFAGGLYDSDTGLVRFGARDYDPSVGRWTAKDPILFDGGLTNLYVYVNNDPIDLLDASGLDYVDINVTGGYGIGGTIGVQIDDDEGTVHLYLGGGATTPGVSVAVTASPSDISEGWAVGVQGTAGGSGQVGWSFGDGGGGYGEVGVGGPAGVAATAYYVFPPFNPPDDDPDDDPEDDPDDPCP